MSDIFLPAAVARTIPPWSSVLVAIGILLHLRMAIRRAGRTVQPLHDPDEDHSRHSLA